MRVCRAVMSNLPWCREYFGLRSATACSVRPLTVYACVRTLVARVEKVRIREGMRVRIGRWGIDLLHECQARLRRQHADAAHRSCHGRLCNQSDLVDDTDGVVAA